MCDAIPGGNRSDQQQENAEQGIAQREPHSWPPLSPRLHLANASVCKKAQAKHGGQK